VPSWVTRIDGWCIFSVYIANSHSLLQVVLLPDRLLHTIPRLLLPYHQVRHFAFSQSPWYDFTRNVRLIIFRCGNRRRWIRHFLLESDKIFYRRLGRLSVWLVGSMFPGRWAYPSHWHQVAFVYQYVALFSLVNCQCDVLCSLLRHRFRSLYNPQDSLPSPSGCNRHCWFKCSHSGCGLFFHRGT
jgi:hypothetical protein